jgi:hypothetical protein
MSADDVVAAVGPSVQRYLTRPDLTQPNTGRAGGLPG